MSMLLQKYPAVYGIKSKLIISQFKPHNLTQHSISLATDIDLQFCFDHSSYIPFPLLTKVMTHLYYSAFHLYCKINVIVKNTKIQDKIVHKPKTIFVFSI